MTRELISILDGYKEPSGYYEKWETDERCPFCNGVAIIDEYEEQKDAYSPSFEYAGEKVECTQCGATFKEESDSGKKSRLEARLSLINKWNKRSHPNYYN